MPQNTNLNVSPYFDDFDSSKNFNKVLFKPGSPIQAREISTLQSILQGQIEKFGKHIFKEGSVVIPGVYRYDNQYYSIKVESTFFGVPVELYYDKLVGLRIQGKTSGVIAQVVNILSAAQSETSDTTLYIKYEKTSDDFERDTFLDGENLIVLSDITYGTTTISQGSDFATAINSNASNIGSSFSIDRGVWFIRGSFVEVNPETIILNQYEPFPSFRVGLNVKEEIVTAVDDNSLYDNAAGFSNFTAPGADRFKISVSLIKKQLDDFEDENFIELQRIEEGTTQNIVETTVYSELGREFARRTFDESGNYYIDKFDLEAKECLNDRHSVFGTFFPENTTFTGNTPSKDLLNIRIGPGKAYVRGYEVKTEGSTIIDVPKPRTTRLVESSAVPFEAGNKLRVNNILNGAQIKLSAATSDFVDLRSARLGATKSTAAGDSIGRARVYDFKLQNAAYSGDTSVFDLFLFDIQTDTQLEVNQAATISLPAYIEGASSGARGYLRSAVSSSTTITLSQVSGKFVKDEQIIINGAKDGRVLTNVTEFDLSDIKSVRSTAASRTFAADVVLETKRDLTGRTFSITSGGVVTSGTSGWVKNFKVGDVIAYKRGGQTDVTFNVVSAVSPTNNNITVVAAPNTITGVCHKALPSSTTTVSDLKIVSGKLRGSRSGFLYAELPNTNIESIDLTDSLLQTRVEDTGLSTDGDGILTMPSLTGTDLVYAPFDEERYTLIYTTGAIETLTSDQFELTNGGKGITISGLTASQNDNVVVHSTQQKSKVKSKQKNLTRSTSLLVTGSNRANSGVSTAIGDGLSFSSVYGKRVQDKEISLDVPDVTSVVAIFEASSTDDPTAPKLTLGSYNGPNGNNTDIILGEIGIGVTTGAAARVIGRDGTSKVEILFKNDKAFAESEEIRFEESGVRAIITSFDQGDKNIRGSFTLDSGQRSEYYDYGRIIRKQGFPEPQGKLKIYYNHYVIDSEDSGDIITANSYSATDYDTIPAFDNIRNTDVIDLRPRVANYTTSTRSPFEFDSRNFAGAGQSAKVLVSDENLTFDYRHYLPRIDRLYLTRDKFFVVKQGTPAVNPVEPEKLLNAFELAKIEYKPYVFNPKTDVKITFRANKRYTMKDIGALEDRIESLEETTSLSLLESKTDSLVIIDPTTGLSRFKNGFLVDPFNSFDAADKTTPLKYDINDGKLVSKKYFDSIDLLIGSNSVVGTDGTPDLRVDPRYVTDLGSQNISKTGDLITLSYDEVTHMVQPFATRVENVNPYMLRTYEGNLSLNPESDVNIVRDFQLLEGFLGTSTENDVIDTELTIDEMRLQNIEFVGTRLKPGTLHYTTFAGEDMIENNSRVVPKLLEVFPSSGAFQIGETVSAVSRISDDNFVVDFRFRLATPNHKDGPYDAPTVVYPNNPYEAGNVGLSSAYSETTTVLNIDTKSLSQISDSNFFCNRIVPDNMLLIGENSGAQAVITNIRLISDSVGALIGVYIIPEGVFLNGTNTAYLTSVRPTDAITPGVNFSRAAADHFSEGRIITENVLEKIEPEPIEPVVNIITNITQTIIHEGLTAQEWEDQMNDPLAQTFYVQEADGIFVTSVDFFFATKSETVPLEIRIVDVVNGYPSNGIRKHSIVIKNPEEVNLSEDGSVPTTFTFKSPVYLPFGVYAFVVIADSQDYNQFISQIGEADLRTANQSELGKVIVTKQPTLGSLFKGQTTDSWTACQLEDMKYTLRKAKFSTDTGTFRMYNPSLNINDRRCLLPDNPIETFSKRVTVGLTSSIADNGVDIGTLVTQTSNSGATGVVAEKLAHIGGVGSDTGITLTNAGTGYEDGVGQSISFVTLTGSGSGATGIATVSSGSVTSITLNDGGTGYRVGDTLTAAIGSKGLGQNLTVTVGVTTGINALVLTNSKGTFDTTNTIISGATTLPLIIPSSVTTNANQFDGTHFKITHPNHGHHSLNDTVTIKGISGDSIPTKTTNTYDVSDTSVVSIASSTGFNFFEGEQVTASNPGFALIGNEIIQYTSVGTNQLSGTIVRKIDDTLARTYAVGTPVQKYELSGISLRKINKQHSLVNVTNNIEDKITLDSYHVKITGSKLFSKDKSGGGSLGRATKNIQYDTLEPSISSSLPIGCDIKANARTTTATSVSGGESSFQDRGFEPLSLSGKTKFSETKMVASIDNEQAQLTDLPGSKSFTIEMQLSTLNENLSPVIDAFRSQISTSSSRINAPIENYATSNRANNLDDPHETLYQTQVVQLENPATSLKVLFAANRPDSSDIRVLYRLVREDSDELDKVYELMPGFDNLDAAGFVINEKNNSGRPDTKVVPSLENQFLEYEFTVDDLPLFTGFQIKVDIASTNQAQPSELLDFRAIAVA